MVYLHLGDRNELDMPIVGLLLCPIVFLLVKRLKVTSSNNTMGKLSSGIYFVHLIVVSAIQKLWQVNSIELTFLAFSVSFAISFVLEKINQRFPYFV